MLLAIGSLHFMETHSYKQVYSIQLCIFFHVHAFQNAHVGFFNEDFPCTVARTCTGRAGESARASKDYAIVSVSCLESLWHLERFSSLAESLSMRVIHLFFHCMLDIAGLGGQTSDVEPVHISYYCVLLICCIILGFTFTVARHCKRRSFVLFSLSRFRW